MNNQLKEKEEFTKGINETVEDIELKENDVEMGLMKSLKTALVRIINAQVSKLKGEINQVNDKAEQAIEMAENSQKVNTGSKVYFSQTELGHSYKVTLSSKAVGNILRIIGLAYKNTPTRPKMNEAIETGIAKRFGNNFKWERKKVDKKWTKWLKEHNFWVEWNKHSTATERRLFVKELHEEYVE